LIIDIYVRVSIVGIELLTIDARLSSPPSTHIYGSQKPSTGSTSKKPAMLKVCRSWRGMRVQGAVKHKVGGAIDAVTEWVEEVFSRDKHQDRND